MRSLGFSFTSIPEQGRRKFAGEADFVAPNWPLPDGAWVMQVVTKDGTAKGPAKVHGMKNGGIAGMPDHTADVIKQGVLGEWDKDIGDGYLILAPVTGFQFKSPQEMLTSVAGETNAPVPHGKYAMVAGTADKQLAVGVGNVSSFGWSVDEGKDGSPISTWDQVAKGFADMQVQHPTAQLLFIPEGAVPAKANTTLKPKTDSGEASTVPWGWIALGLAGLYLVTRKSN